ncbi:hypothetical protein QQF64_031691 [Cirrhinus molitorella]|uniref:Uncharacterized protein n=1 Tax=Cirrhinus molitorella TaxID=172907 RepID=A0ABR3MXN6_9TELE
MCAAIQELQFRRGLGQAGQEDDLLVGFGNYATLTFKDLYDAKAKERKGIMQVGEAEEGCPSCTKMNSLQKYIKEEDAEMLQPKKKNPLFFFSLPKPPLQQSLPVSACPAEELSDADLLAASAPMMLWPTSNQAIQPKPALLRESLLLPEGWETDAPKEHTVGQQVFFSLKTNLEVGADQTFAACGGPPPEPVRCTLTSAKPEPLSFIVAVSLVPYRMRRCTCPCAEEFVTQGTDPSSLVAPLPQMVPVPCPSWLLSVYAKDVLTRLPELKARVTSVYGTILKMDSTKKVTKKLAGDAAGTAAWVTDVGNEFGQVLMCVLTEGEGKGLLPMCSDLWRR